MSQFSINVATVIVLLVLHLLTAWLLLSWLSRREGFFSLSSDAARPGRHWIYSALIVLAVDSPFIYLQIIYKAWHPAAADHLLDLIAIPWLLLQANLIFLGLLLAVGFLTRSVRHMAGRYRSSFPSDRSELRIPRSEIVVEPTFQVEDRSAEETPRGTIRLLQPRRQFLRTSALAIGGIAANASILAATNDDEDSRIERIKIRVPNLPPELKGTTIALISDIHSSRYMERERMERYAKMVQDLNADMIIVAGDFVNSKVAEVEPFGNAFTGLSAPLGVYGVTGNHDYYTRDIEYVCREVEGAGITLLRNSNVTITKNGASLKLLGLDDDAIYDIRPYLETGKTEQGRIENTFAGVDERDAKILICHKPYPFEEYAQAGIDLMLSGHTHGGQIVLGWNDRMNVSVASLASTYIAGLYKARSRPEARMYVSRGVGTAGLPIRVNCPPEVTHIMLI